MCRHIQTRFFVDRLEQHHIMLDAPFYGDPRALCGIEIIGRVEYTENPVLLTYAD